MLTQLCKMLRELQLKSIIYLQSITVIYFFLASYLLLKCIKFHRRSLISLVLVSREAGNQFKHKRMLSIKCILSHSEQEKRKHGTASRWHLWTKNRFIVKSVLQNQNWILGVLPWKSPLFICVLFQIVCALAVFAQLNVRVGNSFVSSNITSVHWK